MRKILFLTLLGVLGLASAAYAATTVTNQYLIKASITPKKSGTKAHPTPIGTTLSYTVTTKPTAGERPNVVKSEAVTIQDVQAVNDNAFKACSTSRLLDPTEGPSTCPAGSKIGSGYFVAMIGPSTDQSAKAQTTCRVDDTLYNGGNGKLVYYFYINPANTTPVAECPATPNLPATMVATLKATKAGLEQSFTIPQLVRHPVLAGLTLDSSAISTSQNLPAATTKVKGKKVGLLESIGCPANGQRQVSIKFTLENGQAKTATREVACS